MRNTVSLHKVCIAKISGLLVLAALAVVFFVTPLVAMGANGNNAQVLSGITANFAGMDNGTPSASGKTFTLKDFKVGNTTFKLTLAKTIPFASLTKGKWLFVDITNPADNTPYAFLATVDTINPATKQVKVLIGTPGNAGLVSNAAVKRFEGKEVFLKFNPDKTGANISAIPAPVGTGWNIG